MKAPILLVSLLITGCSASLDDYSDKKPVFDLRQYFSGEVTAWGIIEDYSGKVTRRFCVDIVGTWADNLGQLHETFYYDDLEQQVRVWKLSVAENGTVTGTAGDVVGIASGQAKGSSFNWKYTLDVPIGDTTYAFTIDDWMFMMDENRMMNRSYMSKFGIEVAQISIFFDKTPPVRKCQD